MRVSVGLVIAALAACLAVTGCSSSSEGSGSGDMTGSGGSMVEYDEQLAQTLVGMSKRAETRRLAELTNFAWDKVYVYSEGASAEEIANDVGSDVLAENYYYTAGNLLVFTRDGEVLRAISVAPDLLTWEGTNSFGSSAKLSPAHPNGPPGLIRIGPAEG